MRDVRLLSHRAGCAGSFEGGYGGDFVYDIPADPAEKTDLAKSQGDVTKRMSAALQKWKDEVMTQLKAVPQ